MSVAQGPPIAVKPIPLHERLRRYSLPDVERTLQMLIANGNLADYDDELANRVQDAIDLCLAVRELLPTLAAPVPAREVSDDAIINAAYRADGEPSDVTRVSEMTPTGWKATTIFDGDAGLLRFARLIENAALKSAGKE